MIVGVDVSSKRVDLAWIDAKGKPQRWHQELGKGNVIDRIRRIRIQWPEDTTEIAIEYPYARGNGIPALWSTVGIITRQAPKWCRVAWPDPRDLRAAIGAINKKEAAHTVIMAGPWKLDGWNEHELDALVTCWGWTLILEKQENE